MTKTFDAVVIGAGEAGALIASLAVDAGKRVAMVYRPPYGSTCLNVGCVPSKYLIHRARVAQLVRTAGRFGIQVPAPSVDLAAIVAAKNEMLDMHRRESHDAAQAEEHLTLVEGTARFGSRREVVVGERVLTAERVFIATGMRPTIPRIDGLEKVRYFTNEDVMDLDAVPERLVVVGGGYIACELGQAYRRLGSQVTIVHSRSRLLPDEEPDVSMVLTHAFDREGIDVVLGRRVIRAAATAAGVRLTARSEDGDERTLDGTHLLLAAGRRPNTDALTLDAAGIQTDEQGFVRVDQFFQTTAAGIYAAGDVLGKQPFTRVSQEEARLAYANAFEDRRSALDRRSLGHAIFTDPEVGSVGLTEAAARAEGRDIAVGYVTFEQITKADLIGETEGFIKYVVERESRALLGAHVIGPQAADLVYDASLLIRSGLPIDALARTVGIFPTLQEGMEGSARALLGRLKAASGADGKVTATSSHIACPECAAEFATAETIHAARA